MYSNRRLKKRQIKSGTFSQAIPIRDGIDPLAQVTATRSILIHTRKRMVVEVAGDIIGRTPVEIHLVPAAVKVIFPG